MSHSDFEHEEQCACCAADSHGHSHEGGCGCGSHEHGEGEAKTQIVRIAVAVVLTAGLAVFKERIAEFSPLVLAAAFAVPYLVAGADVLLGAIKNIFKGKVFDENFLMSLATVGAFATGEYAEAVAVMVFYKIGELFEHYAVDKSHRSIAAAMNLRPDSARVIRDGAQITVHPEKVKTGEIILVKPGERIPLDGVVTVGEASVDTSALTGEAEPRSAAVGDSVLSGCVALNGTLEIEVTKEYENSTVAKILELVEQTSKRKTRAENFITKFARYYTPAVVISAVLLFVIPSIITGDWREWLNRALVFLVVSCPCALVVSVPLTFFGGIGGASKQGILIKGSNYIDALSKTKTVVFDKTGTLTLGSFAVTAVKPQGISESELLQLAAAVESCSNHPIAKSITAACENAADFKAEQVKEIPGKGISAKINGKTVFAGNEKLMADCGVKIVGNAPSGATVHLAAEGRYLGCIEVADEIKPGAAQAVEQLKNRCSIKTVMLTGDTEYAAKAVAEKTGIDEFYCGLLPTDKVAKAEELIAEGTLAFVGDGINDAPVLARADVGIAMGGIGSDAAIEAADVVIMDDKPEKTALAVRIAKKTMNIVRQNVVFALGIKLTVLLLGALGHAGMWLAVFADVGVCVLAICNAMRALKAPK